MAAGRRAHLSIFGNDYPTPDGTGIRDYLHVLDLAQAHVLAIEKLLETNHSLPSLNLGTGRGLSVLEVVRGFEQATSIPIAVKICERRPGDVAKLEACPALAEKILGWSAQRSLVDMCRDGWSWQAKNPNGYRN